jgi:hypothetical protein
LVDSNGLIDIFGRNQQWWHWSLARAEQAAREGPLRINDVVYAETPIRFRSIEDLDATLVGAGVTVVRMPRMALFLAGKAFARTAGLAAAVPVYCQTFSSAPNRHYFPTVELIAPHEGW